MTLRNQDDDRSLREAVRQLCRDFPDAYWRKRDRQAEYPRDFVDALGAAGYMAALIPVNYGGSGLGITEAGIILEEINRSSGNAAACHAQMYVMGTLLRHANEQQKQRYLPPIARNELRLQAFAVTEPNSGSETTRIETRAVRHGDRYIVNGQKIFISRVKQSDLLLLLARTTPYEEVQDKTHGLSVFLLDLRDVKGKLQIQPLETMMNHHTSALYFEDVEIPAENRIGEEGQGFRYLLAGLNAERILIASECLGDADYFIAKASQYASQRVVFNRPIGQNQAVQFPIARAHVGAEAARLMRDRAAQIFDSGLDAGAEANMAKYLASEVAWEAANVCMTTFGGYGLAIECDVERKFREARLPLVAPVANNLILSYVAEHVLSLPRSY